MAIVTGPLMSMSASGTVGNTLTYSNWKGRAYVRNRVDPANPKSGPQKGVRAMFRYLSMLWASLSGPNKATWDAAAAAAEISPFNAFLKENMNRWSNGHFPIEAANATPPTLGGTAPTIVATTGVGEVELAITHGGTYTADAYAIYRAATTGVASARNSCIAMIPADAGGDLVYVDTTTTAGTWFYTCVAVKHSGDYTADATEDDATVT
jgi:hypothetical protein